MDKKQKRTSVLSKSQYQHTEVKPDTVKIDWLQIFEAIGEPAVITDPDYNILLANQSAVKTFGIDPLQMRDLKCHKLFHGSHEPIEGCPLSNSSSNALSSEQNILNAVQDRHFTIRCTPIHNDSGKLDRVLHIATDISQHINISNELYKEKELYNDLVESQPAGVARVCFPNKHDMLPQGLPKYHFEYSSDRFCQISGIDKLQIESDPITALNRIHEDERTEFIAKFNRSLEHVTPMFWEGRIGANEDTRWIHFQSLPRVNHNGYIVTFSIIDVTESKRILEAKHESENKYRTLFDAVLDPTLVADADTGIIIECNDDAVNYFRHPREELIGMHQSYLHDIAPENQGQLTEVFVRHCNSHGGTEEVIVVTANGERRLVTARSKLFNYLDRRLLVGVFKDITESKKAQQDLEKESRRRKVLMDNSKDGIVIMGSGMKVLEANRTFAEMLGYTQEEVLNLRVSDFEAKFGIEELRSMFPNLEDVNTVIESKHRRKDGTVFDVEVSLTGMILSGENLMFAICRDITRRKLTENALKLSESRFRSLFDNVDAFAVQGYDSERRVIYWNRSSEILYGYSEVEAKGKLLEELIIPPPMRQAVIKDIRSWIEDGKPIPAGELKLMRKDSSLVPVYSSHVLQRTLDGKLEMFCLDVDLSELDEVKKELIRAKDAAEASSRAKSEFLANMSHEIRTPLNGVLGMLQLLEITALDAEQKDYLDSAIKSCGRLSRLLSDILDLSRIEAGKLALNEAKFGIESIKQILHDLFGIAAKDKGLNLQVLIADDVPRHLLGDEARLLQILFNLIGNALKFTDHGFALLEIHLLSRPSSESARLLFIVSDSGIGISDDKLKEVFEPFVQAQGSYVREHQGAGLGLSIVRRLVRLMGGTMSVDSMKGLGTRIYFVLPFKLPANAPTAVIPSGKQRIMKHPCRILFAEDDEVNAHLGLMMLKKIGVDADIAQNGREVLELVAQNDYDLILMDVQMPVMDGVEATRRIRTDPRFSGKSQIPIVAMTAYAMSGDREEFLAAGMNYYLAKPVRFEELKFLLAQAVGYHSDKRPGAKI